MALQPKGEVQKEHAVTIRIGSNITSLCVQRNLSLGLERQGEVYKRLSSGARINKASDDAAGLAVSSSLNAASRIYGQGLKNLNDSLSSAAIQKCALDELSKITLRQQELAEQAANGVYSKVQRQALDREARELTNEYNRLINTTEFNGRKLLLNPWEEMRTQFGRGLDNSLTFEFADQLSTKVEGGDYCLINAGEKEFYIWYSVDGAGADPGPSSPELYAKIGKRIDITTDPLNAEAEINSLTFTGGSASAYAGGWFMLYSGGKAYQVYWDVDNSGATPQNITFQNADLLKVNLSSGDSADIIRQKTRAVLESTGDFILSNSGSSLIVETKDKVNTCDAWEAWFGLVSIAKIQDGLCGPDGKSIAMSVKNAISPESDIYNLWGNLGYDFQSYRTSISDSGSLVIRNLMGGGNKASAGTSGNMITNLLQEGAGRDVYGCGGWLTTADLNQDGYLDLLSFESGAAAIRFNRGDGTFEDRDYYGMGTASGFTSIIADDLNGDDKADLLITDQDHGISGVRLNLGNGTFGDLGVYTSNIRSGYYRVSVKAADVNGDSRPDLITGPLFDNENIKKVGVRLNNGDGTFSEEAAYSVPVYSIAPELRDLNGDSLPDLLDYSYPDASTTKVSIRFNAGNGTFGDSTVYTMRKDSWISAVDLNGDNRPEIVSAAQDGQVMIRANDGTGSFDIVHTEYLGAPINYWRSSDLNGDGRLDLVGAGMDYGTGSLCVLLNNGNGTFSSAGVFSLDYTPYNTIFVDVNGDGHADVVTADSVTVGVSINRGNGSFSGVLVYTAGFLPCRAADLNGDGSQDLVGNNGLVTGVILNNGDGTFANAASYSCGLMPSDPFVVDLDNDGDLDLMTFDGDSFNLSVRLNDGSGRFTGPAGDAPETYEVIFGDARGMTLIDHIDLSNKKGALNAVDSLQERLTRITNQVGALGAIESRFLSALNTVKTAQENFIAAEKRIVDADIAAEAAAMVKENILQQIGSAVLAQADRSPELALLLLRGDSGPVS